MLHYLKDDLDLIFHNTKEVWGDLKDSTIFLTGGTGFFGLWLLMSFIFVNRKLELNSKMIILTRNKSNFLSKHKWVLEYPEISFLEGDVNNFKFIDAPVDYIIHAATDASIKLNDEQPLVMFETIVNGTKRILDFAKLKEVKSFLLTSSGAVYGKQPSDIQNISEDYLGSPVISDSNSMYAEGKRIAEVLCASYYKLFNLPVKIARCYAFIGPFLALDAHFAAGNFIKNLLDNEDIIIKGDGTPHRSYMYSADLVIWLWTILFNGKDNNPYNVGSNHSISIAQLADYVSQESVDRDINVIIKTPLSGKDTLRYVPNVDKALNELNLKIYTDINTSIKKTIHFNRIF
ncbi:NAD-dependent epimerase/dehydratase family protein [Flavobacterium hercynium]|uniref:Epimerase n=1 Tax=Flavobacterium hercynium TaxID=387094 RepID=A0A226HCX0_9FLAO|nr:NAD-dependent epimerase/dehydratase family protein [Flavobacterium hercynium]OXA92179.1 epimerase [Flavobacterium hercynium]SMP24561.1 dTDP-glucose 4,6-dehydratase [Flavobacterium hercynium]